MKTRIVLHSSIQKGKIVHRYRVWNDVSTRHRPLKALTRKKVVPLLTYCRLVFIALTWVY